MKDSYGVCDSRESESSHCDNPVHDGPMRETAVTRLTHMIASKKRELIAMEQLLEIATKAEVGSPLEEMLWKVTCHQRNFVD